MQEKQTNGQPTPPEVVVFDLGKVLVDFDYGRAVRRLPPLIRVSLGEVRRLLTESPLLTDYETGRLDTRQFYEQFSQATGFAGDQAEFESIFNDIFSEITPMTAALGRLREAGWTCAAFSNTNPMAIEHLDRHYPFMGHLQPRILSYEHGRMKPDPALYEVVERLTGRSGAALFYVDDREENVAAARDRGWRAVLHRDPAETLRLMAAEGLPAN
ncbi:MAG: HAD family phosphatase [Verrucomicrobia bacterium]|nr:MAG: HAD family phosphatase [Verrucomicrobiota bacterium]